MLQCKPSACGQAAVDSAQLSRDGGSLNPILCPRTGLLLGAGFSLEHGQHRTTTSLPKWVLSHRAAPFPVRDARSVCT